MAEPYIDRVIRAARALAQEQREARWQISIAAELVAAARDALACLTPDDFGAIVRLVDRSDEEPALRIYREARRVLFARESLVEVALSEAACWHQSRQAIQAALAALGAEGGWVCREIDARARQS